MDANTYYVCLRLPRSLEAPLKDAARADGRSISSYVSQLVRERLRHAAKRSANARKD